jgi:hypothetical protein
MIVALHCLEELVGLAGRPSGLPPARLSSAGQADGVKKKGLVNRDGCGGCRGPGNFGESGCF